MTLIRATTDQKNAYDGIYPLLGFITIDGKECIVEDLRAHKTERTDPSYEVIAPVHHHFCEYYTHTLLRFDQKDIMEAKSSLTIDACEDTCDCYYD